MDSKPTSSRADLTPDARAAAVVAERERSKEKLRNARQERIVAGKADAFDCSSEEDVVCPYCGQWFDGRLWATAKHGFTPRICPACDNEFLVHIQVQRRFTTIQREVENDAQG